MNLMATIIIVTLNKLKGNKKSQKIKIKIYLFVVKKEEDLC